MRFPNLAIPQLIVATVVVAVQGIACGADWLTLPSTYTHDPSTGARVDQYAAKAPAVSRVDPTYRESGYRQYRSTLQYGQAADNYHSVEKWGEPVRPYGEWRFPVRPYSAPYSAWGAPLAGMNVGGYYPGWQGGYPNPGSNAGGYPNGGGHPHGQHHGGNGNGYHGGNHPGGGQPGGAYPGGGLSGGGYHGGGSGYPGGYGQPGFGGASLTPYPPTQAYPTPPYYDGAYPTYGEQPRMNDREFYRKPRQ
ncbi:hypothetical protein EC9_23970 [Rosistilla ulvae]|uniref:Uncharacterized protein n=1 Tax=Rosistilla ulvae TaxID=1930277 RepID=A0A517M022_9BACT|nr:hypothetical protein [Rosistilla ulvae]QDS88209.1 hypothetical protein EC9_23970 [Rosistilla ulvae]